MNAPEQKQRKPSKQERAAARNELDRFNPMDWGEQHESFRELQDPSLWVSDTNDQTQLQNDIEMLKKVKSELDGSISAGAARDCD